MILQDIGSIFKNQLYSYALATNNLKMKLRKNPIYDSMKNSKTLQNT